MQRVLTCGRADVSYASHVSTSAPQHVSTVFGGSASVEAR